MAPINLDEVKKVAEWARETLRSDVPALFEKDGAGALKYRSATSAKAYARIRKMYQQALRDRKEHERKLKGMSK
jgi:hypothetical protein